MLGVVLLTIELNGRSTQQLVYICNGTKINLLSFDACVELGIMNSDLKQISTDNNTGICNCQGATEDRKLHQCKHNVANTEMNERNGSKEENGEKFIKKVSGCDCGCPMRQLPPEVSSEPPISLIEENVEKLEQWLRERYASSAFNVCECQPLPRMHGEPLVIS